jgi:hypothetical protein
MEAANEEARENWNDPSGVRDFAADLTESILLGFEYETLVDQWIDTERTDFNGRIFIREATGPEGLLHGPWRVHRGQRADRRDLRGPARHARCARLGVRGQVPHELRRVAQTLRDLSDPRMDAEINRRIHTVLGGPGHLATTIGGWHLAGRSRRGHRVGPDESLDGRSSSWAGRRSNQIMAGFDGFGNETLEEIRRRRDVLGVYRGCHIVTLKNYKDEDDVPTSRTTSSG